MFVYRFSPFSFPLLAIFSPHPKTESLFTGYFIIDPRQTAIQVKLVSCTMKFGLNSLNSVAILVDSSLFTKPHVPRYYAFIRYHVKTEIFPKHYFTFTFIYVVEVAFDYWMVQRTSLMKPWGAKVLDKVHKSFTLCLFDQSWNYKTKNKLYYK